MDKIQCSVEYSIINLSAFNVYLILLVPFLLAAARCMSRVVKIFVKMLEFTSYSSRMLICPLSINIYINLVWMNALSVHRQKTSRCFPISDNIRVCISAGKLAGF